MGKALSAEEKSKQAEEVAAKKAADTAANAAKGGNSGSGDDFTVEDPELLRPKELPLVIKPTKGEWENEEQAEFAKVLNGYAYRNPVKWKKKKALLLAQLRELGACEDPELRKELFTKIQGTNLDRGAVTFKDKRIQAD